jgi:site-specific recombinase XerC
MTTIESITTTVERPGAGFKVDDAQLAAVSFLARYSGRTLEAYRHDLRGYFHWASNSDVDVLKATRPHIELFRAWMEDRGLAASTIDRRLSTVCGFYRFAHIDGRIGSNPAQYVRRPRVHPTDARGLDRSELGVFLFTAEQYDRPQAALAVLLGLNGLRVSEACATNVEDLGFERGHRTLHIIGKGNKPATIPLVPRTARTIDLAVGERHEGRSCNAGTASVSTAAQRTAGSIRSASAPGSVPSTPTCSEPRSSWLPSTRASRSETYSSPPATPTLAPPRSMTVAARTSAVSESPAAIRAGDRPDQVH